MAMLVLLGLWGLAAAVLARGAQTDLQAGLEAARQAEDTAAPTELADGPTLQLLEEAQRRFTRGHDRLRSRLLVPARFVPVLGRQLRSAQALSAAARDLSATGVELVGEAQRALEQPADTGPRRVALVRRIGELAARGERRLAAVDLGPDQALIGRLATSRAELADAVARVRAALQTGQVVATGLADLLAGPNRYLILAGNNAEMRAGSGMFLSVGELSFAGGELRLGEFRAAGDLAIDPPPPITDEDLSARWGWLEPNDEWRNLAATPRFDVTAELASRMWPASGGGPVDGVLALDPLALRAVLAATGPVEVGGEQVTAEGVVDLLLHDQYQGIDSIENQDQADRREQLGLIAGRALGALQGGGWDVFGLADGLAEAARGRHLLAWSPKPEQQATWAAAGVEGRLGRDSLALSVLNRGGNKLDHFLEVSAEAAIVANPPGGEPGATATIEVTLDNDTPEGESRYIAGPHPDVAAEPGEYVGIVALNVPGFAFGVTADAEPSAGPPASAGRDGPTNVLAMPVRVKRGTTATVTFRFRLAETHGQLTVEPSGRVPAVEWTSPAGTWRDEERHRLAW